MEGSTARWGKRAIIEHRPRALMESEKLPLRARHKEVKAEIVATPRTPETHEKRRALLREERECSAN